MGFSCRIGLGLPSNANSAERRRLLEEATRLIEQVAFVGSPSTAEGSLRLRLSCNRCFRPHSRPWRRSVQRRCWSG